MHTSLGVHNRRRRGLVHQRGMMLLLSRGRYDAVLARKGLLLLLLLPYLLLSRNHVRRRAWCVLSLLLLL